MQYLWLDAETTGINSVKNDIIQMACVPVVNGVRQQEFNEFCQPLDWNEIEQDAIDVHGITVEQMRTFQTSEEALDKFIEYLSSFSCRFTISGFNVNFDRKFMSSWFSKHGRSEDFNRLFDTNIHCTFKRWKKVLSVLGRRAPQLENNKLETIAKHYGITINAHDALSDIVATIEVDDKISELLGEESYEYSPSIDINQVADISVPFENPQLHLHSQYCLGNATPKPSEWMKWCEQNDVIGFSCVDHGSGISLHDAIKMKSDKTTCVPGVAVYLDYMDKISIVNVWARDNIGYKHLLKLSSLGFDSPETINGVITPIVKLQDLVDNKEGLSFGLGGRDSIFAMLLLEGRKEQAEQCFNDILNNLDADFTLFELIPNDVVRLFESKVGFTKIKRNDCIPEANLGKAVNNFLYEMCNKYSAKAIVSSGAFFIGEHDKILQDTLMKNKYSDGFHFYESYHVKKTQDLYKQLQVHLNGEMSEDFFLSCLNNAKDIVDQAKNIKIEYDYHLPEIDIPSDLKDKAPNDYDKQCLLYLISLCKSYGRWRDDKEYVDRFNQELDVILKNEAMNFIPYFLLYEDLGREARRQGFLQNIARGSAGGSLISYYLKIIHVDPIAADLPFERFLSHARIRAGSWPDIDMDISRGARPYIMRYLKQKYGMGFAQIATLSTMKTKNAIKDTMMALYGRNRNDPEIKQVCDTIPDSPQGVSEEDFLYGYEDKEGNYHAGQLEANDTLQAFFNKYPDISNIVKRLIGIVRGWSRHASAFIVSTVNLSETRCPMMKMYDKHIGDYIQVSQYDANMVEKSGLVKADILGLKTLDMVTDCVELVKDRHGVDLLEEDENGVQLLYRLPEDANVYRDFYNKATDSSFQFNSSLIKGFVQQFNPTERRHLKDMTAICRPGALDAEWEPGVSAAQFYLDVRNGKRDASFVHEDLREILAPTNGIFCYQEQVMKFLVDFGGHTLEESDQVRGAIAKKKLDVMQRSFDRVRQKTASLGWTPEQTEKVCSQIEAFARYSFNLSHSHAYSELGYITMYLKHHYKLEWWASVLNNEEDEDKTRHYISILGSMVTPPSMQHPSEKFMIKNDKIAAPISVVKSVGPKAVTELVSKGPFSDLQDFVTRVNHTKCNIGAVGQLIKARAADDLFDHDIPYDQARLKFMDDFKKLRKKSGSKFKDELQNVDPLSVFLMEMETNKAFNKTVLDDDMIVDLIDRNFPVFTKTGKAAMPFRTRSGVLVLSGVKIADALLKQGLADKNSKFGFIMLANGSAVKKGVSKKGNNYCFTKLSVSDGYNMTEAIEWNRDTPYRYPENSIVYIEGTIKEGWKTSVSINIDEVEILV